MLRGKGILIGKARSTGKAFRTLGRMRKPGGSVLVFGVCTSGGSCGKSGRKNPGQGLVVPSGRDLVRGTDLKCLLGAGRERIGRGLGATLRFRFRRAETAGGGSGA